MGTQHCVMAWRYGKASSWKWCLKLCVKTSQSREPLAYIARDFPSVSSSLVARVPHLPRQHADYSHGVHRSSWWNWEKRRVKFFLLPFLVIPFSLLWLRGLSWPEDMELYIEILCTGGLCDWDSTPTQRTRVVISKREDRSFSLSEIHLSVCDLGFDHNLGMRVTLTGSYALCTLYPSYVEKTLVSYLGRNSWGMLMLQDSWAGVQSWMTTLLVACGRAIISSGT